MGLLDLDATEAAVRFQIWWYSAVGCHVDPLERPDVRLPTHVPVVEQLVGHAIGVLPARASCSN